MHRRVQLGQEKNVKRIASLGNYSLACTNLSDVVNYSSIHAGALYSKTKHTLYGSGSC